MKKGIPGLAAARIQRWCLELSAYTYEVKHRSAKKQGNVDALSRLPMEGELEVDDPWVTEAKAVNMLSISNMPVSAKQISLYSRSDTILSKVMQYVESGWPGRSQEVVPEIQPYFIRKNEISLEGGCLLWGTRVIVPAKLQVEILETLHEGHPGMVRMKALARLHCWWSNLNMDIEQTVRKCQECQKSGSRPPPLSQNNWAWPSQPWQRVHVDFAQIKDRYFLIMVDAHSKWPEVIPMTKGTTAMATIEVWRAVFGRLGLPRTICSDNGPPFTSQEVAKFFKSNGIKQVFSPPYHPQSNGEAERFVRSFKQGMKKMQGKESQNHCLQEFLLTYRTTPHSTTNKTPSEMMFGRRIRTRLDLLRPSIEQAVLAKNPGVLNPRELGIGERVWAQDYRTRKPSWIKGTISARLSPVTYQVEVRLSSGEVIWKRHIDQIKEYFGDSLVDPVREESDEVRGRGFIMQEEELAEREPEIAEEEPYSQVARAPGVRAPESPRPCEAGMAAATDEGAPRSSSRIRKLPPKLNDYIVY